MLVVASLYGEYGKHNINIAIIHYMKHNDGRWPSSWDDIEPYHRDIILPTRSVAIVKLFHGVAWNIDPHELFTDHGAQAKVRALVDYENGALPVVYDRGRHPAGKPVERWILTPAIYDYLKNRPADTEPR